MEDIKLYLVKISTSYAIEARSDDEAKSLGLAMMVNGLSETDKEKQLTITSREIDPEKGVQVESTPDGLIVS